jgi:Na+:H+ antiporter, NhaA family
MTGVELRIAARQVTALVGPPTQSSRTMSRHPSHQALPHAQRVAERVFNTLERFLHVEAVSGVVLLVAAAAALIWANSPAATSYQHLWHIPITIGFADYVFSQPLHFLINDALMTVFFLVVGMEIRREIHEGALATVQLAALPLVAALGGVIVPALIYLALNTDSVLRQGWAVPTATDIAFAVGVLALLGRSIPGAVRIFLLAIAIIDDIAAVAIIAVFYSGGLDYSGLLIAGFAVLLVLGLQKIGVGSAYAYVAPGALLWFGLLQTGAHPTLAGVVLGLMTPVRSTRARERPVDVAMRALREFKRRSQTEHNDPHGLARPVKELRSAQREMLAPVVRVQIALHPWVAYGVIPLFALANAGVNVDGVDLSSRDAASVMIGVLIALLTGKPIGIFLASWLAVRAGWCRLPSGLTWRGVLLAGCLGGIGFTMSIFISNLAFGDGSLLAAAKLGVLIASAAAGTVGLVLGRVYVKRLRAAEAVPAEIPLQAMPRDRPS